VLSAGHTLAPGRTRDRDHGRRDGPVTAGSAAEREQLRNQQLTVTAAVLSTNDNTTVLLTTVSSPPPPSTASPSMASRIPRPPATPSPPTPRPPSPGEELKVAGVARLLGQDGTFLRRGVRFNLPYDLASATTTANYTLSAGHPLRNHPLCLRFRGGPESERAHRRRQLHPDRRPCRRFGGPPHGYGLPCRSPSRA